MSDTPKAAISFRSHGRVQGVWYRAFTQTQARRLNLSGWVRNESDGTVFGHAEGSDDALAEFISQLRVGPPASHVDQVTVLSLEPEHMSHFTIRR